MEIFEKEKNGENSVIIDEILLYLFESYVNSYFDSIKGNEELIIKETLFGLSLEYLNKSLIFIDTILKQKDNILYEHLGFLLSVAYSKCYLVRLVDIIMNDKTLIIAGNLEIRMKTIEGNDKNKFRYVLKIFILKLIRTKFKDYDSFLKFDFSKIQIEFINNKEEFNFDEKIENTLDYMFIPIDNIEKFDEAFQKFTNEKEYFISLIKGQKNGFDIFICLLINLFISKYIKENYIQNNKKTLDNLLNWNN